MQNLTVEITFSGDKKQASIDAYLGNEKIGWYALNRCWKDPQIVTGYICSKKSGAGVPRELIKKTSEAMAVWAELLNLPLIHKVQLANERSKDLLHPLFEAEGYCLFESNEYGARFYIKRYAASSKKPLNDSVLEIVA